MRNPVHSSVSVPSMPRRSQNPMAICGVMLEKSRFTGHTLAPIDSVQMRGVESLEFEVR